MGLLIRGQDELLEIVAIVTATGTYEDINGEDIIWYIDKRGEHIPPSMLPNAPSFLPFFTTLVYN